MPVSHPLGWEEPVSCSRENGNIQVQETSHPAWQHVFFGSEHTAPTLRQAAHSRGADAPPKRFQRGAPRQDNKQLRRAPWQKTSSQNLPLGEESTEQKDHAYSSKYWSHPLAQNILPSIIQNQADEVKSQNILHFLHPNPVRIPQDWTLEKTVFPQGSSSYNNRFDSDTMNTVNLLLINLFLQCVLSLWHPVLRLNLEPAVCLDGKKGRSIPHLLLKFPPGTIHGHGQHLFIPQMFRTRHQNHKVNERWIGNWK